MVLRDRRHSADDFLCGGDTCLWRNENWDKAETIVLGSERLVSVADTIGFVTERIVWMKQTTFSDPKTMGSKA